MDTAIFLGYVIPNASLYLTDMKGWPNFGGHMDNLDSLKMENVKAMGAKYMVVLDTATWMNKDFMHYFTTNLVIEHQNIKVFQLKE